MEKANFQNCWDVSGAQRNFDGTIQKEFMTEPLWGVGTTGPYGHDGRSINLVEIIQRHGGEAAASRRKWRRLPPLGQQAILAFLRSLVLVSGLVSFFFVSYFFTHAHLRLSV